MPLEINNKQIATDKDGYLKDLNDWDTDIAQALATGEDIELSEAHWEVIWLLREFYQEFELAPAMRVLVKQVGNKLGKDKGRSIYLMQLFPPSPAKVAAKIAGLPRPTNCL
jgi:tRNA 2-thiouridine synthesizing protein E